MSTSTFRFDKENEVTFRFMNLRGVVAAFQRKYFSADKRWYQFGSREVTVGRLIQELGITPQDIKDSMWQEHILDATFQVPREWRDGGKHYVDDKEAEAKTPAAPINIEGIQARGRARSSSNGTSDEHYRSGGQPDSDFGSRKDS